MSRCLLFPLSYKPDWPYLGHSFLPLAQTPRDKPVSFINDIAPLLKENCLGCHDAKSEGKLDMSSFACFAGGGTKIQSRPANRTKAISVSVLTATDNRMPPKEAGDTLPADKIALVERWINEGQAG